jgi:hypothetical protein
MKKALCGTIAYPESISAIVKSLSKTAQDRACHYVSTGQNHVFIC